jgi:hypothetical protein
LASRLAQIEELLSDTSAVDHICRANALALSIAKNAPSGSIAALARRVIVATESMSDEAPMDERPSVRNSLRELRNAMRLYLKGPGPELRPGAKGTR